MRARIGWSFLSIGIQHDDRRDNRVNTKLKSLIYSDAKINRRVLTSSVQACVERFAEATTPDLVPTAIQRPGEKEGEQRAQRFGVPHRPQTNCRRCMELPARQRARRSRDHNLVAGKWGAAHDEDGHDCFAVAHDAALGFAKSRSNLAAGSRKHHDEDAVRTAADRSAGSAIAVPW
jgi:hypothetical protein